MKSTYRRLLKQFHRGPVLIRWGVGLGLILVGLMGIVLPILPGWILLIPGVILLMGRENPMGRWMLLQVHLFRRWIKRRFGR